jgi:hypothetical protein
LAKSLGRKAQGSRYNAPGFQNRPPWSLDSGRCILESAFGCLRFEAKELKAQSSKADVQNIGFELSALSLELIIFQPIAYMLINYSTKLD